MAIGNGPTEYNLLHDRWLIAVGAVVRAHQLALVSPQLREGLGSVPAGPPALIGRTGARRHSSAAAAAQPVAHSRKD
jgi:hypothetical protein